MDGTVIESYLGEIYFWRVIKKDLGTAQEKVFERINGLSQLLVMSVFTNSRSSEGKMKKDVKNYWKGLLAICPNVEYEKKKFEGEIMGFFDYFSSKVTDAQFCAACLIMDALKSTFRYVEKIPKIFTSDLVLEKYDSLFKEKMLKAENFSEELIIGHLLDKFPEFFTVHKIEFQELVTAKTKEYVHEAKQKILGYQNEVRESIVKVLEAVIDKEQIVNIELQMMKVLQGQQNENSAWEVVYKGLCINEEVTLLQIVKFSEQKIFAPVRFNRIRKTLMLVLENYICKTISKTTTLDFDNIVPGSKPEALLLYSNQSKKFWKAILTDQKLLKTDELLVFDKHDQRLLSTSFIRHQNRVVYIYESGGVDDYSLKGSEPLDYSGVYPQRYCKIVVSDCERFIFLISGNSFCIFSSNMSIITFHKLVPVYLLLVQDSLKILLKNNDEYGFKSFTFRDNHLGEAPNTDLTLNKMMLYGRMTLDFGKTLIKEMISSNKFEGESKVPEKGSN